MALDHAQVISAQVVLQSASGKSVDAETIITSENIGEYSPSTETVSRVTKAFVEMGFEVGEMIGISFSITAPADAFEEVFGVELCQEPDGGVKAVRENGTASYEMPLSALPNHVIDLVVAVTFTPPPDFGPTEFFGP